MSDCIFCKIADGRIPAPKLYEDDAVFCIKDIQPQAKTHLLVIPKQHVPSLVEGTQLISQIFAAIPKIAREQGLLPGGFRTVINTGEAAGQTVFHLHVHLLGGQSMPSHFGAK